MILLNIGCGSRFHHSWHNIDIVASSPAVRAHNILQGLPYQSSSVDACYSSHVLEHLAPQAGQRLLGECFRVLRPGGTVRIVVPDLERIARDYIAVLQRAEAAEPNTEFDYDWVMLELYDQAVREAPGGGIKVFLTRNDLPNKEFVLRRSQAARSIIGAREQAGPVGGSAPLAPGSRSNPLRRLAGLARNPRAIREQALRVMLGGEYELLKLGRFRRSGELHLWMYDRYSLGRALTRAGFEQPQALGADESRIPDWRNYHLDTEPDGTIYKLNSLYMEAIKPDRP